jgi:hypothetical protein
LMISHQLPFLFLNCFNAEESYIFRRGMELLHNHMMYQRVGILESFRVVDSLNPERYSLPDRMNMDMENSYPRHSNHSRDRFHIP